MPRVDEVLNTLSSNDPETHELIAKLRLFVQKRFWHEFSEHLTHLIYSKPNFNALGLVEATIAEMSISLDPFLIVELFDVYLGRVSAPLKDKLGFIEKTKELVSKNELAVNYLNILEAKARFLNEDYEKGYATLKEAEKVVDSHRSVPKIIFASLNNAKFIYHWKKSDFPQFYESVIKFLAYHEERKMGPAERLDLASKTLQAALLSDQILTFGDLLSNSFFQIVADNAQHRYLWQLVEIFNQGQVDKLESFLASAHSGFGQDPLLSHHVEKLRRKIRVISLYDSVFFSQKSFSQQHMTFNEIAHIAKIDKSAVEKLIVHVLSIGLLRGYVDEANELFYITGLKPQDLDLPRLKQLRDKFDNWSENIKTTIEFVNKC
jgi:26S proteasome regulatory subunit N9